MNKLPGVIRSFRSSRRCILPLTTVSITNPHAIRNYCQVIELKKEAPQVSPQVSSQVHSLIPGNVEQDDSQYEESVKNRILEKALEYVPINGWSVEALSSGAEAAGYPGISHGLFPNGGGDLVHYFNVKSNNELIEIMKKWPKENVKEPPNKVPVKFIEDAIVTRLLMIEPYKDVWPRAMAIQTLPNNVPNCLASLLSLVDDICYQSGDRSVDFNWYIHRVGLAGIYKAAELFFLTDNSAGHSATRNFVKSRIRDAQLIQSALNLTPIAAAPQTLTAAFVTAKNILGINTLK